MENRETYIKNWMQTHVYLGNKSLQSVEIINKTFVPFV